METNSFFDYEYYIDWNIIPAYDNLSTGEKKKAQKQFETYRKYLNSWNDKDIIEFIDEDTQFGDHLESLLSQEYSETIACFAVDKSNKPIGVIILESARNKNINLEFAVIDKKHRNKGLGTRMLKSLQENIQEFVGGRKINGINTLIRSDNSRSIKAFTNSNFVYKPGDASYANYKLFYCNLRELNEDHNM